MGAACGCDGNSASTSDQVMTGDAVGPTKKDTPLGSAAPRVQSKTTVGGDASNEKSYEAKSEAQMTRL